MDDQALRHLRPLVEVRQAAFFAAVLAAAMSVQGCSGQRADAQQAATSPAVSVIRPVQRQVTDWDEYTGRFEPVASVDVRARVSGYLQSIHFRDGQMVERGQLLFVIDPRPYVAALAEAQGRLAEARSRLTLARQDLARADSLREDDVLARGVIDRREQAVQGANASIATAVAQVERAKLDVEFTRVRSPMRGRISRENVSVGNLVDGGNAGATLLTTIVTVDPIEFSFDVDERSYSRYQRLAALGRRPSSRDYPNPVRVLIGPDMPDIPGRMVFVDNRIDRATGTIRARAQLDNPSGELTPGVFATVRLIGGPPYTALLIPDAAIGNDQSRKIVMLVDANNRVAMREVRLGRQDRGLRVIEAGLKPTDRVIVEGLQRARAGESVTPRMVAAQAARPATAGAGR